MAPRAREAEQLLEMLRSKATSSDQSADVHSQQQVVQKDLAESKSECEALKATVKELTREKLKRNDEVGTSGKVVDSIAKSSVTLSETHSDGLVPSSTTQVKQLAEVDLMETDPSSSTSTGDSHVRLSVAKAWSCAQTPRPASSSLVLHYPCGISLRLAEYVSLFSPVAVANGTHRARMLQMIADPSFLSTLQDVYSACDTESQGFLTWKHYEVHDFVVAAFRCHHLIPPSEGQTYRLFAKFDTERRMLLEARECLSLADSIFRITFLRPPRRPVQPAEHWASSSAAWLPGDASVVTYPGDVTVNVVELAATVCAESWPLPTPVVVKRLGAALETGTLLRSVLQTYRAFDRELCGSLSWDELEIVKFLVAVFRQNSFEPFAEDKVRPVFELFAKDGNTFLEARECLCLADALLRCALHTCTCAEHTRQSRTDSSAEEKELSFMPPVTAPKSATALWSIVGDSCGSATPRSDGDLHQSSGRQLTTSDEIRSAEAASAIAKATPSVASTTAHVTESELQASLQKGTVPLQPALLTQVQVGPGAAEATALRRQLAERDTQIQELERRLLPDDSRDTSSMTHESTGDVQTAPLAAVTPSPAVQETLKAAPLGSVVGLSQSMPRTLVSRPTDMFASQLSRESALMLPTQTQTVPAVRSGSSSHRSVQPSRCDSVTLFQTQTSDTLVRRSGSVGPAQLRDPSTAVMSARTFSFPSPRLSVGSAPRLLTSAMPTDLPAVKSGRTASQPPIIHGAFGGESAQRFPQAKWLHDRGLSPSPARSPIVPAGQVSQPHPVRVNGSAVGFGGVIARRAITPPPCAGR
eukprot:TRINITY_DN37995_c0_g1_i1.p1 TRINITY_DN37995_c0_g1~~TRINITY_DN37995_c0_g1_i1.p1  ORF type:complete len:955 (-),score=139.34 TRINITY_DN37995_c0_g1_i1:186-2627(-)